MIKKAFLAFTVLFSLFGFVNFADAQEQAREFNVHLVDATTDQTKLSIISKKSNIDSDTITLSQADEQIAITSKVTSRSENLPVELAIVLDINTRGSKDGALDSVQEVLLGLLGTSSQNSILPENSNVTLYSAGDQANTLVGKNSKISLASKKLENLKLSGDSAVYKSLQIAGSSFSDNENSVKSVLMFSSGPSSDSEIALAKSALVQSGAQLLVVHLDGLDANIASLVSSTGGLAFASDAESVAVNFGSAFNSSISRSLVSFDSNDQSKKQNLDVNVDGKTHSVSYINGSVFTSQSQINEIIVVSASSEQSVFSNSAVLYVSILIAAIAVTLGAYLVANLIFSSRKNSINGVLSSYVTPTTDDEVSNEQVIQSSIIQKAVSATETFAEKRGFSERLSLMLEQGDIPLRAGEALFLSGAVITMLFGLIFFVTKSILAGILVALVAAGLCFFVVQFLSRRRLRKFEKQLPDTLQLLAGTLRAGYSLPQGMDAVAKETADPMGEELARAMSEAHLGRDLEEALQGVADRLDSPDFAWTVMAIGIQREVGGNLNELLMTVADTIVQRERLRGEVKALTAEGRVSAGILTMMPPTLMAAISVMNPGYLNPLFTEVIGFVLLGLGLFSLVVGLLWMKKVITIDA